MKKLDDFFSAGIIIGFIGNIWISLSALALILLGVNFRLPWSDLAALFFKPPEVFSFWAQFFGLLATFGVAVTNGIVIGGLFKLTGRDFAYLKSIVVCSASVMFAFMILYPSLGLKADQHSIVTTYVAFIANQPFAILTAYLFLRYTNVGLRESENKTEKKYSSKFRLMPIPARKQDNKHLLKPKKLV